MFQQKVKFAPPRASVAVETVGAIVVVVGIVFSVGQQAVF